MNQEHLDSVPAVSHCSGGLERTRNKMCAAGVELMRPIPGKSQPQAPESASAGCTRGIMQPASVSGPSTSGTTELRPGACYRGLHQAAGYAVHWLATSP